MANSQPVQMLARIATTQALIVVPGLPIPYVVEAAPYQTSTVSSVQLPMFLNELPIGANDASIPISSGQQYVSTIIDMILLLQRKEAGIDIRYPIQNALQWRDAVLAQFAQHVRLSHPAIFINSSTNANPITIVTAIPHQLVTGDQVTIAGHLVNTNANGNWIATVIDNWTFTIPTAGNGVGGFTGTVRKTQPNDLPFIVDAMITRWGLIDHEYGEGVYVALKFPLRVREMYVTTIAG